MSTRWNALRKLSKQPIENSPTARRTDSCVRAFSGSSRRVKTGGCLSGSACCVPSSGSSPTWTCAFARSVCTAVHIVVGDEYFLYAYVFISDYFISCIYFWLSCYPYYKWIIYYDLSNSNSDTNSTRRLHSKPHSTFENKPFVMHKVKILRSSILEESTKMAKQIC